MVLMSGRLDVKEGGPITISLVLLKFTTMSFIYSRHLLICLAVSTEYRRVTDGQTDGRTGILGIRDVAEASRGNKLVAYCCKPLMQAYTKSNKTVGVCIYFASLAVYTTKC